MLEGFYTGASGILMQERTINVLTNNMANVHTPGFRAERVISTTFEQELLMRQEAGNTGAIGKGAPMRLVKAVQTNFDESSIEETESPFDFAIVGEGYFNIQGETQQYMTRNGQFVLDEEGYLMLGGVGNVLGTRGPIQLEDSDFTVEPDGRVLDSKGKLVDTLLVTKPAPETELTKFTNGLYTSPDPELNVEIDKADASIQQGCIERPNIDLNREYTQVMEAQRALQACAAATKMIDAMNQKTATQIASL